MTTKREFKLKDVSVTHNTDGKETFVDVDLHDYTQPAGHSTFVARLVMDLDDSERLANRILDEIELAREAAAAALVTVKYWHDNDCRPEHLKPATHWFAQVDHRWVAVADEDPVSWFSDMFDNEQFIRDFLVKDITDVPLHGYLVYSNASGTLVEELIG